MATNADQFEKEYLLKSAKAGNIQTLASIYSGLFQSNAGITYDLETKTVTSEKLGSSVKFDEIHDINSYELKPSELLDDAIRAALGKTDSTIVCVAAQASYWQSVVNVVAEAFNKGVEDGRIKKVDLSVQVITSLFKVTDTQPGNEDTSFTREFPSPNLCRAVVRDVEREFSEQPSVRFWRMTFAVDGTKLNIVFVNPDSYFSVRHMKNSLAPEIKGLSKKQPVLLISHVNMREFKNFPQAGLDLLAKVKAK